MESSRNYFGESGYNHVVKKTLKRHLKKIHQNNSGEPSHSKSKTSNDSEELTSFINEFPRKSHIQKLSLYLTPLSTTHELVRKLNENKFVTEEYAEKNFPTVSKYEEENIKTYNKCITEIENAFKILKNELKKNSERSTSLYAQRQSLEDFISEVDEKEKKLNTIVDEFKESQLEKMEKLTTLVNSLLDLKQDYEKNVNSFNVSINELKKEIKSVDKKALYSSTFNNYKRTHESNFITKVESEEKKLKDELVKIIEEKIRYFLNKEQSNRKFLIEEKVPITKH